MVDVANKPTSPVDLPASDAEAVAHLAQAIADGKHWFVGLLEAIGLWGSAEEVRDGCTYHYLIAGEAFDWLALAERLCETDEGHIPTEEKNALLFTGRPPLHLTHKEVRDLIGHCKYHQYLNYFYGITLEEALILVMHEEVLKEKQPLVYNKEVQVCHEVYQRLYGATKAQLLRRFRREKGYAQAKTTSLTELREFTYWLFKYRFTQSDKAKVASDTKKALAYLKGQWTARGFAPGLISDEPCPESVA